MRKAAPPKRATAFAALLVREAQTSTKVTPLQTHIASPMTAKPCAVTTRKAARASFRQSICAQQSQYHSKN